MELNDKEMTQVNGGISWALVTGIGALIVYITGILSGYTNPSRCNN